MYSFWIFTYKECSEGIKTFKTAAIFLVLLLFGMTSPVLAKLTPDLLKMAGSGITITLPPPTFLDAYAQFYKNIGQMGMIIILIIYSISIVGETTKGTTSMILTKRLSRSSFVCSKFFAACIVWIISYIVSAGVCILYTVYLFPAGKPQNLLLSLTSMLLFGIVTIAIAIFSSAVFKNFALCVIGGICIWGLTLFTAILPWVKDYTPAVLYSINVPLLTGGSKPHDMLYPAIAGVVFIAALLTGACAVFQKREL